jgi:hypothetical protein
LPQTLCQDQDVLRIFVFLLKAIAHASDPGAVGLLPVMETPGDFELIHTWVSSIVTRQISVDSRWYLLLNTPRVVRRFGHMVTTHESSSDVFKSAAPVGASLLSILDALEKIHDSDGKCLGEQIQARAREFLMRRIRGEMGGPSII